MSKYTTELRFICEMKSGFKVEEIKDKTVNQIVEASRTKIFDFSYPLYDNTYKPTLEKKILKHYYTREIAAETYGLWHHWLDTTLNEIMPKYNKLYKAEHDILDKELRNIDVHIDKLRTDDLLKEGENTRTDNLTRTNNLREVVNDDREDNLAHHDTTRDFYSDTPQGGIDYNELERTLDPDSLIYLTDYRRVENDGTNTGTVERDITRDNTGTVKDTGTQVNDYEEANTGTQDFDTDEYGYRGSKVYAELLADYSSNVLNIDMMIIRELEDLFFKLW